MLIYKNLSENAWHFFDEENDEITKHPFGSVVYTFIGHILNMSPDGDIRIIYDKLKDKLFKSEDFGIEELKPGIKGHCIPKSCSNAKEYINQVKKLIEVLSSISDKSPKDPDEDIYRIAEEFKWFGYNAIRDLPYDKNHDAHVENVLPEENTNIRYLGIRKTSRKPAELFEIYDYSVFFTLDLYAYLFDRTYKSISLKTCEYCNRGFHPEESNQKLCNDCRNIEGIGRIRRNERRNNPLEKKIKHVHDYFERTKYPFLYNKIYDFDNQVAYYKDKLKGKPVEINEQYDRELPFVSSEEDIIGWIDKWFSNMKQEEKKSWQIKDLKL